MVDPFRPNPPASAREVTDSQAIENLQGALEHLVEFAKIVKKSFEQVYDTKNKFEKSLSTTERNIAKTDLNHLTLYNMHVALSERVEKLEKAMVTVNGIGNMHKFVKDLEDGQKELSNVVVLVRTFVDNLVNKHERKLDALDKSSSELKGLHTDVSLKVETLEKGMKTLHRIKTEKGEDGEQLKAESLEKEKQNNDRRLRKKRSVAAPKVGVEAKTCKNEASAVTPMETWDSDQEWEVEEVLDKRTLENGQVEYFLKWKGWHEGYNSWETGEKLNCPQLLEQFELKNVTMNEDPMIPMLVAEELEDQEGNSEAMPDL